MKYCIAWSLTFLLLACQSKHTAPVSTSSADTDLKAALPGTWEAVSFRIQVNSLHNTDSSFVMEVHAGEWEKKLQIRPIQTTYDLQHRYQSVYKNLTDSVTQTTRGIWNSFGDTLMLISAEASYEYEVRLKGQTAEFRSRLDWDGDGQADDEYLGTQKLIKKAASN